MNSYYIKFKINGMVRTYEDFIDIYPHELEELGCAGKIVIHILNQCLILNNIEHLKTCDLEILILTKL